MRLISIFASALALASAAVRASVLPPRDLLDICAFIDTDLVIDVAGITRDFGHIDLCLCISALPLFIETNVVALAAIEALGITGVVDVLLHLTDLINGGPPCLASPSKSWKKRDTYVLNDQICPRGQTLCGVQSAWHSRTSWECLDTQRDIESCGGCSVGILGVAPSGTDCTSIDGAESVACNGGKCQVFSCRHGYEVSECGTMCVRKH